MKLILLSVVVVGCSCWKLPAIPSGQRSQYYTQQSDGSYKFGYDSAEGLHHVQEADGSNEVRGTFGVNADHVHYTAGTGGFQVVSSAAKHNTDEQHRHAPEPVAVEASDAEQSVPQPVQDTAEVAEAKRQFRLAYDAAAHAAEKAPDVDVSHESTGPVVDHFSTSHQHVYFTPGYHQHGVQFINLNHAHPAPVLYVPSSAHYHTGINSAYAAMAAGAGAANFVSAEKDSSASGDQLQHSTHSHFDGHHAYSSLGLVDSTSKKTNSEAASVHLHESEHVDGQRYAANQANSVMRGASIAELLTHPVQVEDTAEVAQAKEEFHKAYKAAAEAAASAPDTGIISAESSQIQSIVSPVIVSTSSASHDSSASHSKKSEVQYATAEQLLTHPVQVEDTAEVAHAKEEFYKAYKTAAEAAASAPDTGIITAEGNQIAHTNGEATVESVAGSTASVNYLAPIVETNIKEATLEEVLAHPVQVEDTAEVARAKAEFHRLYQAAAAAAEASPDVNIVMKMSAPMMTAVKASIGHTYSSADHNVASYRPNIRFATLEELLTLPKPVEDTEEVAKAKQAFHVAYKAAASAAAAANQGAEIASDSGSEVGMKYHQQGQMNSDDQLQHHSYAATVMKSSEMTSDHSQSSQEPSEIISLTSSNMNDGSYHFAYESKDSTRQEMADAANNVRGSYSYLDDNQVKRMVNYMAGGDIGFVVSGEHLPQNVEETTDVASAKAAFMAAYQAALASNGDPSESHDHTSTEYGAPVSASISFVPVHMGANSAMGYANTQSKQKEHQFKTMPSTHHVEATPMNHHTIHHVQHQGDDGVISYSLHDGVVVMQANGFSSPNKFGYSFQ